MILINSCDEKRFCTYLAEAIQEMSPDFCRRLLYARPLETEDLSSYWYTAMCRSSLSERAEKGFSTYEMLDVLEKFGGNPKYNKCSGARRLFFDLADKEDDIFEQYLEAAEFFLTRTNLTCDDLSCKDCSVDEFRLLEIWFKRDLDIVLSRNVRRIMKIFTERWLEIANCLSALDIVASGRIRLDGKGCLPKRTIFLIASFTVLESHELANWHVESARFDYDGSDMLAKESSRGVPVILGSSDDEMS